MLFGQGDFSTQIVVLDDLECSGNELSLFNCPHPGTTVHDCTVSLSDANLICGISGRYTLCRVSRAYRAAAFSERACNCMAGEM